VISTAQAAEYLDSALGISVPSFVLAAAVETVEGAEPAMAAAGYSEATQVLVQTYAVAIIAAGGDPRRINSQNAPSGASRSFKNADAALTALRRTLEALDTAGTVAALVGPDPAANTVFLVAA
jgi:hypothetical protein